MNSVQSIIHHFCYDKADPRVRDYPLLGDPTPLILITSAWLFFVVRIGPKYMADKKPMKLKNFMQFINLFQIIANAYLIYEFLDAGWLRGYEIRCQPVDESMNPNAIRMANATYIYTLLKLFDFIDTIIFVVRRKENQISFLHLYHHCVTLFFSYCVANFVPGGSITMGMLLNCIIHVLMYTYYFVAALGPQYQKYLWWKKYLTRLQLLQLALQSALAFDISFLNTSCSSNTLKYLIWFNWPLHAVMIGLFVNFYVKTYKKKCD